MVAFDVFGYPIIFSWDIIWAAAAGFVLFTLKLFYQYVVLKWIAAKVLGYLEPRLNRWWAQNPVIHAIISHYHNKGMGRGHDASDPLACQEGRCQVVC